MPTLTPSPSDPLYQTKEELIKLLREDAVLRTRESGAFQHLNEQREMHRAHIQETLQQLAQAQAQNDTDTQAVLSVYCETYQRYANWECGQITSQMRVNAKCREELQKKIEVLVATVLGRPSIKEEQT